MSGSPVSPSGKNKASGSAQIPILNVARFSSLFYYPVAERKPEFFFKVKEGENVNHMNT